MTKLHTCGTQNVIPVVTLIFIVLKGCGLTEIHVIGSKTRNLKIDQELIVHMLLSAILEKCMAMQLLW